MANDKETDALVLENARLREELVEAHVLLAKKEAQLHYILNIVPLPWVATLSRFVYVALVPALEAWRMRHRRAGRSTAKSAKAYDMWAKMCETIRYDPERAARRIAGMSRRPLVSLLVPVSASDARGIESTIESVRAQYYDDWEICLQGDLASGDGVRPIVEQYADLNPRIRVGFGEYGGNVSSALNGALAAAEGEYVAVLASGGRLTPDALVEAVSALEGGTVEALYADEDESDAQGRRSNPSFKPDWSPDLLLSKYYIGRPTILLRSVAEELGGFREAFDATRDYDLWLRIAERTDRIGHIPMVLYHRPVPSPAGGDDAAAANQASRRALAESLERREIAGVVENGLAPGCFRVVRKVTHEPLVSIIIPTRDRVDLLSRIIEGIERRTDYSDVEVLIVDNGSVDRATLDYLAVSPHRVIRDDGAFNYSRLNNLAVREARGELVLLLNNDTDPIDAGWLRAMVEHAVRPEVGAVGARLLYPSGRLQHGGVILGPLGTTGHIHKHLPANEGGYLGLMQVIRDVSAVTAACLLMRRALYDEVGGLNETDLAVAYNDVDLCMRIRERGYLIVWTPYASLTHYESESRGRTVNTRESDYVGARWSECLFRDPYYTPNLTQRLEDASADYSRPDGYREGLTRPPFAGLGVSLVPGRRVSGRFWSTQNRLAAIALFVDRPDNTQKDAVVRLALYAAERGGEPSACVARGEARVSTTTHAGDLFLPFDSLLAESRDCFTFVLEVGSTESSVTLTLHACAPEMPAFRLLYR